MREISSVLAFNYRELSPGENAEVHKFLLESYSFLQAPSAMGIIPRYWHNIAHVAEVLNHIEHETSDCYFGGYGNSVFKTHRGKYNEALYLAAWFHDVFIDPVGTRNEEESGRILIDCLGGKVYEPTLELAKSLILCTKNHRVLTVSESTMTQTNFRYAAEALINADLEILASENPQAYASYARCIRWEFAEALRRSGLDYDAERAKFLTAAVARFNDSDTTGLNAPEDWCYRAVKNMRRELREIQQKIKK